MGTSFTPGQVLTAAELNAVLTTNPAARMYCASSASPTSGAAFSSNWTSSYATGGCSVSATTGITVPVSGYYDINFHCGIQLGAAGYAYPQIYVNTVANTIGTQGYAAATGPVYAGGADTIYLSASATVSMALVFTGSGTLVNSSTTGNWVSVSLASQ